LLRRLRSRSPTPPPHLSLSQLTASETGRPSIRLPFGLILTHQPILRPVACTFFQYRSSACLTKGPVHSMDTLLYFFSFWWPPPPFVSKLAPLLKLIIVYCHSHEIPLPAVARPTSCSVVRPAILFPGDPAVCKLSRVTDVPSCFVIAQYFFYLFLNLMIIVLPRLPPSLSPPSEAELLDSRLG